MNSEEEKPKAFKVDDRRRFSAEGELKPEFRGADQTGQQSQGPEAVVLPSGSAVKTGVTSPVPPTGEATEISFATFMVGLSTQALFHLGEIADPQGGEPQADLPAAQQLIDIIGMLKEKTRGNLDHDEQTLLDAILFELRMKYVERARQAPR
ncbi:MAG TPA: DUF1844 domain-containing protein [Candidatus Binataceae bacterium]|nr:DUF1844 domain-containing protein [Candidatus Binataceae bacterium]